MEKLCSSKLFLVLLFTLRYDEAILPNAEQWKLLCEDDLKIFGEFQKGTEETCKSYFSQLVYPKISFLDDFNRIFSDRNIQFVKNCDGKRAVLKRLSTRKLVKDVARVLEESNGLEILQKKYFDLNRVGGNHICGSPKWLQSKMKMDDFWFWIYLSLNIQPLILTLWNSSNLPVSRQMGLVGLTSLTSYEGKSVNTFFKEDFMIRLKIATLLLKATLLLTLGFNSIRIYLTDLTLDNVVVDEKLTRVTFVDLDNVILLGPTNSSLSEEIHHQEIVECNGCFAFRPKNICKFEMSDINLFSALQMLNEDLFGDETKGFLHSIPKRFLYLRLPLRNCLDCKNCDRFECVKSLIKMLEDVQN